MSLSKQQRQEILEILSECEADTRKLLDKLNQLELYDCSFSLKEISRVLHISKERVRQIELRALQKLKEQMLEDDLEDYLTG